MLNISVKTIPHKKQRYDTAGDYFKRKKQWQFYISEMQNDYTFLVLIHELIEWYLTQKRKISVKEIDRFDLHFEEERNKNPNKEEPGNDLNAPYHNEHLFATSIERQLASELKVDWNAYDKKINSLKFKF